ncbi:MAG TPA: hypothetical protein VFD66_10815 [Verrucomicrobiae bacterium]|nr:hypothetical protein [Verrucomicrobiae bacterium]
MKLFSTLLAGFLLSTTAHAELAIYLQSYTQTETGLGRTINSVYSGYFIIDNQGSQNIQIDVSIRSKSFWVWTYSNWTANYLRTISGQTFVMSIPMYDLGSCFMKGTVSSINVGSGYMPIPRSMIMSGICLYGSDPDAEAIEFKGRLTFDSKDTVTANLAGNNMAAELATMRAKLLAKGYTENQTQ